MSSSAAAPTITIDGPFDINLKPTTPPKQPGQNDTTTMDSCYLCDEENPGDFNPTTKFLESCLLCTRKFCPLHKGKFDHVCNINHSTYYHEHPELEGTVFPSLGEREKALFVNPTINDTSASSTATGHKLESLEEALHLSESERAALIEEKDFVGADIAV